MGVRHMGLFVHYEPKKTQNRPVQKYKVSLKCSLLALSLLLFAGCASNVVRNHHSLVNRISNRGPVALSNDNPFLAGNLLLNKEIEKSADLKGFITHRGQPNALEVTRTTFGPLLLQFYYTKEKEKFVLEELAEGTWMIKGPFPVGASEPVILTKSSQIPIPEIKKTELVSSPAAPVQAMASLKIEKLQNEPEPQFIKRLTAKHSPLAEISPEGDIVHYVTSEDESLEMLARWYTLDKTNTARLARMNKLSESQALSIGDSIIIPSYLVKNKVRLDEIAKSAFAGKN